MKIGNQLKWVLSVSVAGKTQYFVGDFDGKTFTSPDATYTAPNPATVLNDFEGNDYGNWTTTGTAFGSGPVNPGPDVTGRHGNQVVDSFGGSDSATGTLTSPAFTIDQKYLNFLIGGGNHPYVPGGSDAPPAGDVFADFEGDNYGANWTATGDFAGTGPSTSDVPGKVGAKVLDTCVGPCDPAVGTISSPDFTIGRDYINLLVGGGNHPLSGPNPTAISLVVAGNVVASTQGKNSPNLDWVAWNVAAYKGQTAHIEVTDQRTEDWGHLLVDHIVFSDAAAAPWNQNTSANLIVDGQVVRTATGQNGPGLDWASWDLSDLQGRQAQVQLVDRALTDWGHLIADYFTLAAQPAQSAAQRVRWIDYGNDYYAAVTFNNVPKNERLMVGWMGNWDYAQITPTGTWRGQQSVLRKLTLQNVDGKPTLIQTPVDYDKLVRSTTTVNPFQITNGTRTLAVSGKALQIDATLTPSTATEVGIDVRVGNGQKTRVGYNTTTQQLYVDRTISGNTAFSAAFPGIHSAPLKLNGGALKLKIFVDTSSVEVFANGGRISISDLIYPDASSQGVQIFGNGGAVKATSLTIKALKPAISR